MILTGVEAISKISKNMGFTTEDTEDHRGITK